MGIIETYNADLLYAIKNYGPLTYSQLEKVYKTPEVPGVVQAHNACFDSDLETLKKEGYIKIDNGGLISYVTEL